MTGWYDYRLVVLSVLLAISASYAALDSAARVTAARGWARSLWLIGGATAMGFGIWSMHFTGMHAFKLPIPVHYYWPTVLVSLLVAVASSGFALYAVAWHETGHLRSLVGSVLMGSGIVGLHYIAMAAMRLPAVIQFEGDARQRDEEARTDFSYPEWHWDRDRRRRPSRRRRPALAPIRRIQKSEPAFHIAVTFSA